MIKNRHRLKLKKVRRVISRLQLPLTTNNLKKKTQGLTLLPNLQSTSSRNKRIRTQVVGNNPRVSPVSLLNGLKTEESDINK